MIGHPNSEAEECKIQIDTGLFVLLIHLFVQDRLLWHWLLHLRWFLKHLHLFVPNFFLLPEQLHVMNPSQWTYWNSLSDQQHPGLINITQVNNNKTDTLQTDCERSDLAANPVLLQPCRSHFCLSVWWHQWIMMFLASPCPLSTEGIWMAMSHCRQLLLAAVQMAFLAFFLIGSLDESLFFSECLKSF